MTICAGAERQKWTIAMKNALLAVILLSVLALVGCQAYRSSPSEDDGSIPLSSLSLQGELTDEDLPAEVQGSGSVEYMQGVRLNQEQETLLLSFMDMQYQSLAGLELKDPSPLFADPEGGEAIGNRTIWEYLIATRKMQRTDLSLAAYRYTLACQSGAVKSYAQISLQIL